MTDTIIQPIVDVTLVNEDSETKVYAVEETNLVVVEDDGSILIYEQNEPVILEVAGTIGPPGPIGPQGPAGVFDYQGTWTAQNYTVGQSVIYNGSSYLCILDTVANEDPSNTTYWDIVAARGSDGLDGADGADGATGTTGPQGPKGDTGDTGIQGPQGIQGDTGLTGPQGDQGPQGISGPQGDTGLTGPKGDAGATGPQGIQGDTGPQGLQGVQGIQGDTGDTGDTGIQGIQGPQGVKGDQGVAGPEGPTGPQGIQGIQGDEGPQGDVGADGISILWLGDWSSVTYYHPNDAIAYDGSSYICIQAHWDQSPTDLDSDYWDTLALKGRAGPQGPSGDGEVPLAKQVDFIDDDHIYIGEALPGTAQSSATWRIKYIEIFSDSDVSVLWADGTDAFTKTWNNRLIYTYS